MRRRRLRQRGFTLTELIVYVALVTGSMTVIIGLELAASRAAFLERALVDLELRGDDLCTRFRDDLRQATHVVLPPVTAGPKAHGTWLIVQLATGQEVRYELDESATLETTSDAARRATGLRATRAKLTRLVLPKPGAEPRERTLYASLEKLSLEREVQGRSAVFTLEATFAYARGGEITARRTFRVTGSPAAEEAP